MNSRDGLLRNTFRFIIEITVQIVITSFINLLCRTVMHKKLMLQVQLIVRQIISGQKIKDT